MRQPFLVLRQFFLVTHGQAFPAIYQSFYNTLEDFKKTACFFVKSGVYFSQVALLITASKDKEVVAIKVVIPPTICGSILPALAAALA